MICEKCLHDGICYMQEICNNLEQYLKEYGCEAFDDRSEWIHSPCNIGDVFFRTLPWINKVDKCTVLSLTKKVDEIWKIGLKSGTFKSVFEITTDDIGKTVFLTHEEAEKALKERESNESL